MFVAIVRSHSSSGMSVTSSRLIWNAALLTSTSRWPSFSTVSATFMIVVARALAQEAAIVLLDEPTAALDIGHQQQALELLDLLRAESELTLVAAMHDLTLAAQYADRMVLLDEGRVVADGPPAEVLTEELVARHYDANVRIVRVDDRLAIVPARGAR